MSYIMSTSLLLCLVVILANLPRHKTIKPFWRNQKSKPKPTLLPSIEKDPEFYRKLREEIPPKNETAKKFIKNFLRIRHRGKRSSHIEDVVIVMDGSGSIGLCEFNNGKKALKALMQYKQPGIDAKYAMVTFASQARRDFNFLPQLDAAAKMSGVKFPRGATNTQAGLAEAFDLFITGKNCSAYCSEISFFSLYFFFLSCTGNHSNNSFCYVDITKVQI
ncbi:Hypothetical predicted protein [Paramuricea clavata]|uniref:Uncharacterized protein n=1 Tax=Paramuricea clavata TaxID=317549 RepID=A0A7D9DGB6_PARCT|nr:Hypothetical predicted protein [Paramuricea clavata]